MIRQLFVKYPKCNNLQGTVKMKRLNYGIWVHSILFLVTSVKSIYPNIENGHFRIYVFIN